MWPVGIILSLMFVAVAILVWDSETTKRADRERLQRAMRQQRARDIRRQADEEAGNSNHSR